MTVSILGWLIQVQLNAAQRQVPSCSILNLNDLLEHDARLHSAHLLQSPYRLRVRRNAMLTDEEGRPFVMNGKQNTRLLSRALSRSHYATP
ncbi:hypothetical protein [Hyalangium rubrum]|uniref:Uncharacterized protein n=1 Tax=Hyalangium rubrum TaxID=3103134 RepID=A0ABU5H9K5_9BACT|nr:hypothetical protein [Hyalangium sp. s54d21]MDY7229995.1 hypothetical protein [Hyalangium sp. s54d21]